VADGREDAVRMSDGVPLVEAGAGHQVAPLPANEAARLRTLQDYGILDTGRDARFEELAAEVASACGTPIATITFVDEARQWFKAAVGLTIDQTDRDIAFCSHTILDPDHTFVVEDATRDARFAGNPLVMGDPRLVAYAGAPMVAPDGTVIGTVCAMDVEPRSYSPKQLSSLQRIAAQVVELLGATSSVDGRPSAATAPTVSAPGAPGWRDVDGDAPDEAGWNGREGSGDDVLALTRPLIEAIGEDVDLSQVLMRFCSEVLVTFGWWAARIAWVQGDVLRQESWLLAEAAPPALQPLAESMASPVELDDLSLTYREPAVHDVGMLRWVPDRDVVAGVGGRHAVVLDIPGANSLAARIIFLLPSARALSIGAIRTLTTASAVLPRVIAQDRARRELTYRATHDMLTGLLNRDGLASRYPGVASPGIMSRAVLHVDLDGFKEINDRLGHRAGDEVLAHVARQLAGRIRPTDTAARLGGDEFLVVLDGIVSEEEALQVARRLLRSLCGSFTVLQTERVDVTVSIGLAMWGRGMDLQAVVEAADQLMYSAKELGGAAVAVDTEEGRRLLGVSDGDDRDLDAVLSGAIQVSVAAVRDGEGQLHGTRVALGAEVRHPAVEDMAELVLGGIDSLLAELGEGEGVRLTLVPSAMLWTIDGLVLRLLAVIAAGLRGPSRRTASMRLVLPSSGAPEETISQALMIRDALGVDLVVGGFGAAGGDLSLVDRVAPVALELAPEVLGASSTTGPSSAQIAAWALARQNGLELILPVASGPDGPTEIAPELSELLETGGTAVRYVDVASTLLRRREPPGPGGAKAPSAGRRKGER